MKAAYCSQNYNDNYEDESIPLAFSRNRESKQFPPTFTSSSTPQNRRFNKGRQGKFNPRGTTTTAQTTIGSFVPGTDSNKNFFKARRI